MKESCCFLINYRVLGTASADSYITVNPHCVHIRTCKFASCQNVPVTPKSTLMAFSWSFTDKRRTAKRVSHLMHAFPAEVKQGEALPSCFSSHTAHTVNKCPYNSILNVFFFFFHLLLLLSLLKMAASTEPKCYLGLLGTRRVWGALGRKSTLNNLCSNMKLEYCCLWVQSLNRITHKTRLCTDLLVTML